MTLNGDPAANVGRAGWAVVRDQPSPPRCVDATTLGGCEQTHSSR